MILKQVRSENKFAMRVQKRLVFTKRLLERVNNQHIHTHTHRHIYRDGNSEVLRKMVKWRCVSNEIQICTINEWIDTCSCFVERNIEHWSQRNSESKERKKNFSVSSFCQNIKSGNVGRKLSSPLFIMRKFLHVRISRAHNECFVWVTYCGPLL